MATPIPGHAKNSTKEYPGAMIQGGYLHMSDLQTFTENLLTG